MNSFSVILRAAAAAAAVCGAAAASDRVVTEHAETVLAPERSGLAPGETTWFTLSQKLQDGWHVYWKNPGDSGLPLELQWTLPPGYSAGEPLYPLPEQIPIGPLANFGHHGSPSFLVALTAPADAVPGDAVQIELNATWLICEEICVPEEGAFSLELPVESAPSPDPVGAKLAEAARSKRPVALEGDAVFAPGKERLLLKTSASEDSFQTAFFFPDAEGLIEPSAKQVLSTADGEITLSMTPGFAYEPQNIETLSGVLVFETAAGRREGYALEAVKGEIAPPATGRMAPVSSADGSGAGLALLLATAFLGGMLLNIMPCVFPIVFIKAASLMRDATAERRVMRRHGLLYGAGVVATFAALGGLMLALRAGGEALGWGFHLQSPPVVLLSAYVLFLVGLNLAGVFEVGASLQDAGGGLAEREGALGAFFTGALAVFVAAPCIGPLLSAPMGAAILLPPAAGMAIFIAMALGLAAPYAALSFSPALGRMLPKPGPWMRVFKQALAFPVFAAAAFFLWVLAQQTGPSGLAGAFAGAVLLALAAWLFELGKKSDRKGTALQVGAAVIALAALAPLIGLRPVGPAQAAPVAGETGKISYDEAVIQDLTSQGRPVFVDFTAAWCVTCQFNKLTVLNRQDVAAVFADNDVVYMTADWTRRDPEITEALQSFGANGVPLYVFYRPDGTASVLPLPLTARAIIAAAGQNR